MMSAARRHPAEFLIEWLAPAMLSAAAGWSAWKLGGSPVSAAGAALVALAIGLAAIRLSGTAGATHAGVSFAPVPFDGSSNEMDELLLDDPLVGVESDARVAQLFAGEETTPGELIVRISDYLGGRSHVPALAAGEGPASPPDASAALHAALANIRASLR